MQSTEKLPHGPELLVTGDLIFSTKIVGTARAMGIDMQVAGSADAALERLRSLTPHCVIIDLGLASLSKENIGAIVQAAASANVLAFGSHVDTERLQQARDAGCTDVMPRSKLSSELPALLQKYCAAGG
jgi:DNA-binding NarL/FixJ family response regulator